MQQITISISDEAGTKQLGKLLADALPSGSVIALCGTLGAGKTRLVQAVTAAGGVDVRDVVSPTFVMIHEYPGGRRPVYHFDAYRIKDEDEFEELGPEEYFDSAGLTFVEWADRVERCLPAERLEIQIEVTGETAREFKLQAIGKRFEPVLAVIEQARDSR